MTEEREGPVLRRAMGGLLACMLAAAGTGCVSSTLESGDFRPVGGEAAASRSVSSQNAQSQDLTPQPLSQAASQTGTSTGISDDTATGSVADPAKRQQALEEIRAKAAASSGEKTRIGTVPEAASEQMSLQEQSAIAAELEESRRATGSELSDAEVEARKAAIRRLQQKGKTHYERALDSIEN